MTSADAKVQLLVDKLCDGSLAAEAGDSEWKRVVTFFIERTDSAKLEQATEATEVLCQHSPNDPEILSMLIKLMARTSQAAVRLVGLLEKIATNDEQPDASKTLSLPDLLVEYASESEFHRNIAHAAQKDLGLGMLRNAYLTAIKTLTKDSIEGNKSKIASLRYFYGVVLFYHGKGEDAAPQQALELWETNIYETSSELFTAAYRRSGSMYITAQLRICEQLRNAGQYTWEQQITKLKQLIEDKAWLFPRHETYKLARFYRTCEKPEHYLKALECLEPHIQKLHLKVGI
ncbi:unnamed protein product [Discula destructiva]